MYIKTIHLVRITLAVFTIDGRKFPFKSLLCFSSFIFAGDLRHDTVSDFSRSEQSLARLSYSLVALCGRASR